LKFRNGSTQLLITTDLSARGLDIPLVENVIHYQLPGDQDQFIHRNGRTARMTATGNAYILYHSEDEIQEFSNETIKAYNPSGIEDIPTPPELITIELSKGKKDKINKVDVLGFLTKSCGLAGKEVGVIEIKPYKSYVAVPIDTLSKIQETVTRSKLKGKSIRVKQI